MLNERSLTHTKKKVHFMISPIKFQNRQNQRKVEELENRLPLCDEEKEPAEKRHEGIFQGDSNVLYLDRSFGYTGTCICQY